MGEGKKRAGWLAADLQGESIAPARSSPLPASGLGGGRLKGAAWRRLKAKQLLIYNVAKREIVAKKDKDAGIAGILQSL